MYRKLFNGKLNRLIKDKSGNFALVTALILPVLFTGTGLAIDVVNQISLKAKFQSASDSVSLVLATRITKGTMSSDDAVEFGTRLLNAQMSADYDRFSDLHVVPKINVVKVVDGGVTTYDIEVGGEATQAVSVLSQVSAYLGKSKTGVAVSSVARAGNEDVQGAFSMAFVVDVSGSMGWKMSNGERRIDALKRAADALFVQFDEADKEAKYVRTGVSTYASNIVKTSELEWGTSAASSLIKSSWASGGTASTKAFKWAYKAVRPSNNTETKAHQSKNGQEPSRFILLMTDGSNNNSSDDRKTKKFCDKARDESIVVYAVALDAPKEGKELMGYCAFSSAEYFEAETADALVNAFQNIGAETKKSLTRLVK